DWSALPVQSGVAWALETNSVWLHGTSTQLQEGDSLLILGIERETWDSADLPPNGKWAVVVLNDVRADSARNLTYVAWDSRLSHRFESKNSGAPTKWTLAKVLALRLKAPLYGHNAPNPYQFVSATQSDKTSLPHLISGIHWQWNGYHI